MTWIGWLWIGDRWERVCIASTLGECSRQLGKIGAERGIPCRFQVLTGGGLPTFTPVGRSAAETAPRAGRRRERGTARKGAGMRDDETGLTAAERRRFLLIEFAHWERLTEDARVCGLKAIYERRRTRLRQLRVELQRIDTESACDIITEEGT
jgi:hypothetical protein